MRASVCRTLERRSAFPFFILLAVSQFGRPRGSRDSRPGCPRRLMANTVNESKSYTGRRGRHQTRWSVKLADRVSSVVITVGGIATIVAVCLVFFLLLAVVLPMFRSAALQPTDGRELAGRWPIAAAGGRGRVSRDGLGTLSAGRAAGLSHRFRRGRVARAPGGRGCDHPRLLVYRGDNHFAIARSDGKLQLGKIEFAAEIRRSRFAAGGHQGVDRRDKSPA